jgi:hypothetical protein
MLLSSGAYDAGTLNATWFSRSAQIGHHFSVSR